jgi:hypothetical protein
MKKTLIAGPCAILVVVLPSAALHPMVGPSPAAITETGMSVITIPHHLGQDRILIILLALGITFTQKTRVVATN